MTSFWTPGGTIAIIAGLGATMAGSAANQAGLVTLGISAILGAVIDRLLLRRGTPRGELEVSQTEVLEGDEVTVRLGAKLAPLQEAMPDLPNTVDMTQESGDFLLKCPVRGPQVIAGLRIRTRSPLGLWVHEETIGAAVTINVAPRPRPLTAIELQSRTVRAVSGRFSVNRPGQGFDFFALRGYQSGDTMRSVNWKASARRDDLIVNQRQLETQTEMGILIDARAVSGLGVSGSTPLDVSCRVAFDFLNQSEEARDVVRVGVYGNGVSTLAVAKPAMSRQFLAHLSAAGKTPCKEAWDWMRTVLKSKAGPILIVSSGEADPSLAGVVGEAIAAGHAVSIIAPSIADAPVTATWQHRTEARETQLKTLQSKGAQLVEVLC